MTAPEPKLRRLGEGLGFTEGPVFTSSGAMVVTSITQGVLYKLDDTEATVLCDTGGGPNGATEGRDGRLYIAQNGGVIPGFGSTGGEGGVQVVDPNGSVSWFARGLVTPNDLCFGPDGFLYVTDPTRPKEVNTGRIWRVDPVTGDADCLVSVDWYPNGIGFAHEDDAVYIARMNEALIVRCSLDDGRLGEPETVVAMEHGHPDGFAFDIDGNIVIGAVSFGDAPGDVQVWSLEGKLLDTWQPGNGNFYTNLALDTSGRMLLTASDEGSALLVEGRYRPGLSLHPFRN